MPKPRNKRIYFDKVQMYFGKPYVIDVEDAQGTITVYQPTIGDIVDLGEDAFYSALNIFIANTTSFRLPLWQVGIDWNLISDFELFTLIYQQADLASTKLLFGDVDISSFELFKQQDDSFLLKDPVTGVEITETVYQHISQYLQEVFNIHPEEKITQDPVLKRWYIQKDERELHNREIKDEQPTSSLLSIISSCVNHPGFKYDIEGLKHVGVCQFFDSVSRLQIYESSTALLKGMYSGFIDGSKISSDQYNFMKDI